MKEKVKAWMNLIESGKLEDASEDIQMNICDQLDDKLHKYIFKLLLCLSHAADKCRKQNHITGKSIAELAKLLCSLLKKSKIPLRFKEPDDKLYVLSLYHIVRCLISLNLYNDAADVCCYSQPGDLYIPKDEAMGILAKIASLWRFAVNNIYHITDSLSLESYDILKSIIKHEMDMIQIAYENCTQHLITRISIHIEKIATIDKGKNIFFDDFCKYMLEYLTKVRLWLDKDKKYEIYGEILNIICIIICKDINMSRIQYAVKTLKMLCSNFKTLLMEDEECHLCFQHFQSLCAILLTPVMSFEDDSAKSIRDFVICDKMLARRYRYTESLRWNAFRFAKIIEPIFTYWETYIKIGEKKFLDTGILLETISLILHMSVFFMKDVSYKCKSCLDEKCTVDRDLYNTVTLKCKCVHFVSKFPAKTLPEELCVLVGKILEQTVVLISEMKECKCKRWTHLWATCGALTYNMGISSEHIYKESMHFYYLLCTCIFRFQGVKSEPNYLYLENPVSTTLHRLCTTHYTNGVSREAMTVSALNALLTYNTQFRKAFDMWAHIKKKYATDEITKLTMLECLRNDQDKISEMGFTADFSKYNLIELCLSELRCLLEERIAFANGVSAVLQELEKLKPTNRQYAYMTQLLGHYLLDSEQNSSILEYHKRVISNLKQDKSISVAVLCLEANLAFFTFLEELHTMNKQTLIEMENTKFALYAPKLPEVRETKSPTVVPAYTMLKIKKESSLLLSSQKCLKKWKQLLKYEMLSEITENLEPNLILCILVTFGEYCRIYRREKCEAEVWMLAHRLASEIGDLPTIIYVTGRSISLRQINYDWITTAKEYATKHRDSKDRKTINAIAIFWISLADFYFQCGKCDDAKKLLNDSKNLPGISFSANTSVYLFRLDTIVCNFNLYEDNVDHESYTAYIAESLYTMINLSEYLSKKNKSQEILFGYDVLFTATLNLAMRVNHLLSFREISAHLVQRVKLAQSLGAVMRTAEMLKSLCYIDLSRTKLDDCEVKLQGLEHMLNIETFQLSMNTKLHTEEASTHLAVSPARIIDPVRDVPQRDASPVLGKKVFDLPRFMLHKNCNCYECGNASYQYLVFATTYIRAQLYALQCHNTVALDHFYGAFKIRQRLFVEEETVLPENLSCDEIGAKRFSWQARSYITDYVQLLIDFSYFLEINVASRQQDASDIANLAINICRKYKLERHPVYISAEEVVLNRAFQAMLELPDCLDFMVPQIRDIDISKYVRTSPTSNTCITPSVHNRYDKKPVSIRRRKNPVVLNLDKIAMSLSDDEDGDTASSTAHSNGKPKLKQKPVKRNLLLDELSSDANSGTESKSILTERNRQTVELEIVATHRLTMSDGESSSMDLFAEDVPVTTKSADKLVEEIEKLKINSGTTQRTRKVRTNNQKRVANFSKNVNRAVELVKNMAISEETNVNIDSNVEKLNNLPIENENTSSGEYDGKTVTVETPKQNADGASTSSTSRGKIKRCRSAKLPVNNDVIGVRTRSRLRNINKPS